MSRIEALSNVPEISFIENITLESIRNEILSDYKKEYTSVTGEETELPEASPVRLMIYSFAAQIYQAYQFIDRAGKMNLLKYSEGKYLDHLGAFKKISRLSAAAATVMLEFRMNGIRASATGIPGGTRVKSADLYFYTSEYVEIPIGETSITVSAFAAESGTAYNGCEIGSINRIVDPVPYISSVTNINVSSGGSDVESDDDYTYRIFMAPFSYSVAGPAEAYRYWALQARADIEDVCVYTPAPCEVNVAFLLDGGILPDETAIGDVEEYLRNKEIRPLTDLVVCEAPLETEYELNLTYYVNRSDGAMAASIQTAVNVAVEEYKRWQRKIGRDINPSELIKRIVAAGAKRAEVIAPVYVKVDDCAIASCTVSAVTYGGLEND